MTTNDPSRSKTPYVLGGCGCLSIIIALVLFVAAYRVRDAAGPEWLKPKQDLAQYVNTREGRGGKLAESYVDFSFSYPKSWTLKPTDPDQVNYVTVEKNVDGKTYENLNVGYFQTAGSREANEQLYSQLVASVQEQFAQQFPNLQKVHERATKVGDYDAYEALWSASVEAEGQPVSIYIRAILLPTPDGTKGVTLLMMGTSFNPNLKKAEDLGTTGELADVVKSFKF